MAAFVWSAADFAIDRHWNRRYSPGPLANVHALWNDRCDVCHATSRPISADNWLGRIAHDTHVGDASCSICHQGPPHHPEVEKPGEAAACTACHREHQGERASLLRVSDDQCIRCHADLPAHTTSPSGVPVHNAIAFDGDRNHHPEFKLADPGRLKFNHQMHMTRGIWGAGDKALFMLERIPERQRSKYAVPSVPKDTPVQLQCSSCHQLDAGGDLAGGTISRSPIHPANLARQAGAYFLPISYEIHCQACHPLSVGHEEHVFLQIPHRLARNDIHALLEGFYAPRYLRKQAERQQMQPLRPLPGRPSQRDNPLAYLEEAIRNPVARAEQELYETRKGCVLCHELAPDSQADKMVAESAARRIVPTDVPSVWLRKASFNHSMHRLLECRYCHPQADAYTSDVRETLNPDASQRSSDVLLPTIDNCFACHSSARQPAARSDCVECHRYHNGGSPLEGKGSPQRGPASALTLEEFHTGRRHSSP